MHRIAFTDIAKWQAPTLSSQKLIYFTGKSFLDMHYSSYYTIAHYKTLKKIKST